MFQTTFFKCVQGNSRTQLTTTNSCKQDLSESLNDSLMFTTSDKNSKNIKKKKCISKLLCASGFSRMYKSQKNKSTEFTESIFKSNDDFFSSTRIQKKCDGVFNQSCNINASLSQKDSFFDTTYESDCDSDCSYDSDHSNLNESSCSFSSIDSYDSLYEETLSEKRSKISSRKKINFLPIITSSTNNLTTQPQLCNSAIENQNNQILHNNSDLSIQSDSKITFCSRDNRKVFSSTLKSNKNFDNSFFNSEEIFPTNRVNLTRTTSF